MLKNIKNNIYWAGKADWELKKFHGMEYSTHRGSTYNSYLIKEEKTVLIDTVWLPFAKEFVNGLKKEIPLESIDYIVANHAEIDHSGAMGELMALIPDVPVYCTQACSTFLKGQFHQDWNFKIVRTGDRLPVGNRKELVFIEAPMLHWPDSMFTYLTGDSVLFSNDAFGQHYANEALFNDLVDKEELYHEAIKYYANILNPFGSFVTKKIKEFLDLKLPLDIICPSHGIIWRKDPEQIIKKYSEWADSYQENRIAVVYDTMWNSTKLMAEQIADGIRQADPDVAISLHNISKDDKNDVITEIFRSKSVLIGSSTINNSMLFALAGILEMVQGLRFKGKKAAAFGSYGWSGEAVGQIEEKIKKSGFELVFPGLKIKWKPDEEQMKQCRKFGGRFAEISRL